MLSNPWLRRRAGRNWRTEQGRVLLLSCALTLAKTLHSNRGEIDGAEGDAVGASRLGVLVDPFLSRLKHEHHCSGTGVLMAD
jgi:hypothetical protein